MLKLYFLLLIATLSLFPSLSHADCCFAKLVRYKTMEDECEDYGGTSEFQVNKAAVVYKNVRKQCAIRLCGDGRPIISGTYCGVGSCNIFGCDCNGGCIKGNPQESFQMIHGDDVYKVT